MRIRLMHNPNAGAGHLPEEELAAALRSGGHEVLYHSAKDDEALAEMESDPGELVVVAGGDGTIARIAKRLIGRGVPIAILPAGTANNLAAAVGATTGFAAQLANVDHAERRPFDAATARWNGGECPFLESVGGGLIARAIVKLDEDEEQGKFEFDSPEEEKKHVLGEIRDLLAQARPAPWTVEVDGRDLSGDYLLVEAMNIPSIGTGLKLAPGAGVADGTLDVVLIGEDRRRELDEYLQRLGDGDKPLPMDFAVARGRRVVLDARGEPMHVDDDATVKTRGRVELTMLPRALTFWVT